MGDARVNPKIIREIPEKGKNEKEKKRARFEAGNRQDNEKAEDRKEDNLKRPDERNVFQVEKIEANASGDGCGRVFQALLSNAHPPSCGLTDHSIQKKSPIQPTSKLTSLWEV